MLGMKSVVVCLNLAGCLHDIFTNKRVALLSTGGIKKGKVTNGEVLSLGYPN